MVQESSPVEHQPRWGTSRHMFWEGQYAVSYSINDRKARSVEISLCQLILISVKDPYAKHDRMLYSLRKHAYSNILKILPPKNENFQIKNCNIFQISAQNIDRGGGSNEYPQSMFLSRNKKNNVYPCKPQFYYIKVGLRGSKLYRYVFVMHVTESRSYFFTLVQGFKKGVIYAY